MNISSTKTRQFSKESWFRTRRETKDGGLGTTPAEDVRDLVALTVGPGVLIATATATLAARTAAGDPSAVFLGVFGGGAFGSGTGLLLQHGLGKAFSTGEVRYNEVLRVGLGGALVGTFVGVGAGLAGAAGVDPLLVGLGAAGLAGAFAIFNEKAMNG